MWSTWDRRIRDAVLFAVGVAGIVNELFFLPSPRPVAYPLLGGLIGLPLVLGSDERRRKDTADE